MRSMPTYHPQYYLQLLKFHTIPAYPCDIENNIADTVHNECIKLGVWPMLALTWLQDLAKLCRGKKVLELYAGGGWLAKYLHMKGIAVVATDSYQYLYTGLHEKAPVHPVYRMSATAAVTTLLDMFDVVLLSWPPDTADVWDMRKFLHKKIVYIGNDACKLPTPLQDIKWDTISSIPSWPGYTDYLQECVVC